MGEAQIRGTTLHYQRSGRGPDLLLLHAFPLAGFMWSELARTLEDIATCVCPDLRGFGATPPGQGPLTMDEIADDAAALLDLLGIEKAIVSGCSMGGYAALAFARRYPARLLGLCLQDTRAGADTAEGRVGRGTLAAKALTEGAAVVADAFLPRLLGASTAATRPELRAALRERIVATSAEGLANGLLGLGLRQDSTPTLDTLRVPTLVLCGEEDVVTPPAESEALHRGIAGSRLVLIPRAGHLAALEQPEAVGKELRELVRSLH